MANANIDANHGFESELWKAAECNYVVFGLILLKCISGSFEEQLAKLGAERNRRADPEHPDDYRAAARTLRSINAFTREAQA